MSCSWIGAPVGVGWLLMASEQKAMDIWFGFGVRKPTCSYRADGMFWILSENNYDLLNNETGACARARVCEDVCLLVGYLLCSIDRSFHCLLVYLSVCLHAYLFVSLCVCLFLSLVIFMSVFPSVHPSIRPFVCLSVCLFACLFVFLITCLSICIY